MEPAVSKIRAVLFDRDGTLVEDVPYNGDPARVKITPGAGQVLDQLRAAGIPLGVISNQSGVARGMITIDQVEAVNRRVEELLGPFEVWLYCPHGPDEGCACRKPLPGMVLDAARALGIDPSACLVIGDKQSDVDAASAAGAHAILVGGSVTLADAVRQCLDLWSGCLWSGGL